MFANPQWFNGQSVKKLPGPQSARGWAFYAACMAAMIGPAVLLIARGQIFPEATIWLGIASLAFWLEMRGLRRDLRQEQALRDMYVIDENNADPAETGQYELQIKQTAGV